MGHHTFAEKSGDALPCAIEELIGNHELHRLVFFLKRPHRGNRDDAMDAELVEAVDIRAKIQFRRQNTVATAVSRQKCNAFPFQFTENVRVRWVAEWGSYAQLACIGQT